MVRSGDDVRDTVMNRSDPAARGPMWRHVHSTVLRRRPVAVAWRGTRDRRRALPGEIDMNDRVVCLSKSTIEATTERVGAPFDPVPRPPSSRWADRPGITPGERVATRDAGSPIGNRVFPLRTCHLTPCARTAAERGSCPGKDPFGPSDGPLVLHPRTNLRPSAGAAERPSRGATERYVGHGEVMKSVALERGRGAILAVGRVCLRP